jgi:hypothetical protein
MVEVEIRTPIYDEESQEIVWRPLALVRADGDDLEVFGDGSCVPLDPVVSMSSGKSVEAADNPEEWARNLPYAYRSGDLAAVIRRDDDPPALEAPEEIADEPAIPEPPMPVLDECEQAESALA